MLSFDDFDLAVDPFEFAAVDEVVIVVSDAVAVALKHVHKLVKSTVIQRTGQHAPFIQCFAGPGAGPIRPDMLEPAFY